MKEKAKVDEADVELKKETAKADESAAKEAAASVSKAPDGKAAVD